MDLDNKRKEKRGIDFFVYLYMYVSSCVSEDGEWKGGLIITVVNMFNIKWHESTQDVPLSVSTVYFTYLDPTLSGNYRRLLKLREKKNET